MKDYPSGKTPAVNATDINRAAGTGDGDVANDMVVSNPANMSDAVVTDIDGLTDGSKTDVVGTDIRDLIVAKALEWERVRNLRFELDGDVEPAGSVYLKYGYVVSGQTGVGLDTVTDDPAFIDPSLYDRLDVNNDISLDDLNIVLAALKSVINSRTDLEYSHTIHYCHSQCHSQCHGSRGRR